MKTTLNSNWRFYLGDEPLAWQRDFDDSIWKDIYIPHDFAVEGDFDTKHSSGTGYLQVGKAWYRNRFTCTGKGRTFLTFDGVYQNAMVWVNGYYLGKRPNGYIGFTYDITDFVRGEQEENVLCVFVDHVYAADSRWFTGSGIYRKVTLTETDHVCFDLDGIHVTTPVEISDNKTEAAIIAASVNLKQDIRNYYEDNRVVTVRNTLLDANGNVCASSETAVTIPAGEMICVSGEIHVDSPHLWSDTDPYLYTLTCEILADGALLDAQSIPVGIRDIRFDADRGFFINGTNKKLKGVCVHHDAGCLGAAVREKVWQRRLEKLKTMGCNAIRLSHNPHMPELLELCDRMGFYVIDEAFDEWEGVKNKWQVGHNVYPPSHRGYFEEFPHWHEMDLSALIRRDRNHPCVIQWSIGNEIDYPNDPYCHEAFPSMTGNNDANKPASERMYNPNRPNAKRLVTVAKNLVAIVKQQDTSRPVTAALAFPELSTVTGLADVLDVVGYNYKEHLYVDHHKQFPGYVLLGSENGQHPEAWKAVRDNDFISAQFLWTGIDFLGETVGWPCHGSQAGAMDIAGNEKPIYYMRKSWWNDEPMVKLFTALAQDSEVSERSHHRKWAYAKNSNISVCCFTNCDRVEFFVNDTLTKTELLSDYPELLFIKTTLSFGSGTLKAIGYKDGHAVCEDILLTTGTATEIHFNVLDKQLKPDGMDMTHIEVELRDEDGNLDVAAENIVTVTVSGNGYLMGIENGNLFDNTPYYLNYRRAYAGKLLLYVSTKDGTGDIIVTATAEGLTRGRAVIRGL